MHAPTFTLILFKEARPDFLSKATYNHALSGDILEDEDVCKATYNHVLIGKISLLRSLYDLDLTS